MSRDDDIRQMIEAEPDPAERAALVALVDRLERERPVPSAGFRASLRRRLLEAGGGATSRPQRVRLLVAAYAGSGSLLLAVAAVGLAGAGPLAP
jgi:hypothetical protein